MSLATLDELLDGPSTAPTPRERGSRQPRSGLRRARSRTRGAESTERPPATTPTAGGRETFLDVLRGVALLRVVIWHALAAAAISWIVAAMPAMFFVAGSLLARSLDRQPAGRVLASRLRRLLVPFWVLGAVVLTTLILVHQLRQTADTVVPLSALPGWVVPLVDPHGSNWEAGWASTPLWYLRCYLWLLLLSPLLRLLHRRFGLVMLVVPLLGVFAVDLMMRHPDQVPEALFAVRYYLGDLATFGIFWILGFSHRDAALAALPTSGRLHWAVIGAASALVWVRMTRPDSLVVNDSYPLLLFVGVGWLGLFLAAEPWIARIGQQRRVAPVVAWLGRRAVTIYLWHPIAIVGAYWLRAQFAPATPRAAVLPVVALLTLGLCLLFGRFEDIGAGRPGRTWPLRDDPHVLRRFADRLRAGASARIPVPAAMVAGLVAGLVLLGIFFPAAAGARPSRAETPTAGLALPPAPSGKPTQRDLEPSAAPETGSTPAATGSTPAGPEPAETAPPAGKAQGVDAAAVRTRVQSAVDDWRAANKVDGVQLGVLAGDGSRLLVASGTAAGGAPVDPASEYPITSITKTMTATLILQLVADGTIGLDDPLPALAKAPNLPFTGKVTVRQLLNHTAGVLPYDKSPGYAAVSAQPLTPESALALIADQPLEWEPGSKGGYSNSGYLVLGLLAEQLAGTDYASLLAEKLARPAGLTATRLDSTPTAGWTGFSAGGVVSTLNDQLSYGDALYRRHSLLDPTRTELMMNVDNAFHAGLGAFPTCPCSEDAGSVTYSSIGHNGGQASLQWAPDADVVIALNLSESMWTNDLTLDQVGKLLTSVEAAVVAA